MTDTMHRSTTFIPLERLSEVLGLSLTLASETGQRTGSFKFRAAYHVASQVPHRTILAASSGNFGQALAHACQLLGKSALIVMPTTSARVKIEAVRGYGGQVELVDVQQKSRAERVAELSGEMPEAYVASAYDDPLVIAGNATLGDELADSALAFDEVIVPVGGGGLSSGVLTGLRRSGSSARVYGAEPALANDAARSLRAGTVIPNASEPATMADGARTLSLGRNNWEILRTGLTDVLEVEEDAIARAVRELHREAGLRAEPTGALALAALMSHPGPFKGRRVCCVVSGGNVDADVFDGLVSP